MQSDIDSAHKYFPDNSTNLFIEETTFVLTLYLLAYEDGTDRLLLNVDIQNLDAGELPRRKHTTWRKFEIRNTFFNICGSEHHAL